MKQIDHDTADLSRKAYYIWKGLGIPHHVRLVNLSANGLTEIDPELILELSRLPYLEYATRPASRSYTIRSLDLSKNKLISLPPEIAQLSELTFLDLSYNQNFGHLPESLSTFKKLKIMWEGTPMKKLAAQKHLDKVLKCLKEMRGLQFIPSVLILLRAF